MTIGEVEQRSGMERANIRFYEREGLIAPARLKNGYRDYTEADVQILLRIKLLRSLHISLEEIKKLKSGEEILTHTLERQIEMLEGERQGAEYAQIICRKMQSDQVTFDCLKAEQYLDNLHQAVQHGADESYFLIQGDRLAQAPYPWRRYFARSLDIALYQLLWQAFLGLVLRVNLLDRGELSGVLDAIVVIGMMLFVEPLLLHCFGTTPGKAVFTLQLGRAAGGRLSYQEGLARTWSVIGRGMGYLLPIYSLYRFWKSFRCCYEEETEPWDDNLSYTIKDTKWYRGLVLIGGYVLVFFGLLTLLAVQRLPPNRGELTVAEFSENFNYYADYFGIHYGYQLNEFGTWVKRPDSGTVIYLAPGGIGAVSTPPEFSYVLENGTVAGVYMEVIQAGEADWIASYDPQMLLASLAMAGAQRDARLYSNFLTRIGKQIESGAFQSFSFDALGLKFSCQIEYSGYLDLNGEFLFPEEGAQKRSFSLSFSIQKLQ